MKWLSVLQEVGGAAGILAYHGVGGHPLDPAVHISPGRMTEHLEFVASAFHVLPLREYLARRTAHRSTRRCVVLTFDDGYVGVRLEAHRILQRLDLPATVFVTTDAAMRGGSFWWDRVRQAYLDVGGAQSSWTEILAALGLANDASPETVREWVLQTRHGRWPEAVLTGEPASPLWRAMDFDELGDLARDERFDFGVHSVTHPALPQLDPREQELEIRSAFEILRERLPRVQPVVAYPYGLCDGRSVAAARRAGMTAGLTMKGFAVRRRDDPFRLPRLGLSDAHGSASIDIRLTKALRFPLTLRKNSMKLLGALKYAMRRPQTP